MIYATNGKIFSEHKIDADVTELSPCSHKEADTRLLLHARDAVQKGYRRLCIRTVDTDVVILAIAMFSQINSDELWLAFGIKLHFRYMPIHEIVRGLDPVMCKTLDVTQFQHLEDEGKRQPGVCGKYFLMSLKHLKTSCSWKKTLVTCPCHYWSDL